jgi:hypothetical protein
MAQKAKSKEEQGLIPLPGYKRVVAPILELRYNQKIESCVGFNPFALTAFVNSQ